MRNECAHIVRNALMKAKGSLLLISEGIVTGDKAIILARFAIESIDLASRKLYNCKENCCEEKTNSTA